MKTVLTENDLKILSERDSGGNFIYNGSVLKNVFKKIDNIFIEKRGYVHEGGRGPHSSGKLLGEFGYKKKINLRPSANLFNDYDEDMVHCDWCEFLGLNAIHPLSWISEHKGRNGTCKYMTRYRNNLRTPAELKKAASSRYFETVLRLFREKHLNEAVLLNDELDILCYEQHGEECFNCGSTEKLSLDHILPLYNFYANTLNNMIPLCKSCNSSKIHKWPCEFYTESKLILLSKISGYSLSLLNNPTFNYDFIDWFLVNEDLVHDYTFSKRKDPDLKWEILTERVDEALAKRPNDLHFV